MVVFPGSPPVPPLSPFIPRDPPFWGFGVLGIPPILPRDPRFWVFLGASFSPLNFSLFWYSGFPPGFTPFLVLAFLGFPNSVDSLCRARGGSVHRVSNYLKNSQKRGVWGGDKKCQKRVKKGGKSKMTFSKCGRRGQNSPYPPTSHEKSAK